MKNFMKIFYCMMILGFATSSFSQVTFGARVGANFANVDISSDGLNISPDGRVGLTIGGLVNIGITEAFSVQPEVHFIQKGYKFEFEFFGETSESTLKTNYLEIPIHAKYRFGGENNITGFVMAGPAIGYALSGKVEDCDGGDCETTDLEFDEEDGLKRADIGVSFGGGVHIGQLFVDVRYVLGVSNIAETEDGDDDTVKNKGFQIGVGYMF
jgi:hypothetical protein